MAGRLPSCPELRSALFDWFVETRRRARTRLPLVQLKEKAQLFARLLKDKGVAKAPRVTKVWLRRFRKEYCISLRAPNRVSKVPRAVLEERLRIM
eukprot:15077460-Alexandrium_andersonii.AAC.1